MKGIKHYEHRLEEISIEKSQLDKKIRATSYLRGIIFLVVIFIGYMMYNKGVTIPFTLLLGATVCMFIGVIILHQIDIEKRRKLNIREAVNEKGIARINRDFSKLLEKGEEFLKEENNFSSDLDIFGENSLFQLINTTITKEGRETLGEILSLKRNINTTNIIKLQDGIRELACMVSWREDFIVEGSTKKKKTYGIKSFLEWSKADKKESKLPEIVAYICLMITFASIFFVISGTLPFSYIILVLMINFIVIKVLTKDAREEIDILHECKNEVIAYGKVLALIEEKDFKATYLNELKSTVSSSNISCKKEMKTLTNILDWVGDSKANAFYFIINIIFFSDIFIMKNIYKWRMKNKDKVDVWFKAVGEFDALNSIANIDFDFEDVNYPRVLDGMRVKGNDIRHPLIGERAIGNSYSLSGEKRVTLITGSNMSGKSTFLRTIGINLVLAYIGAPTFANEFSCGVMNIYTCMRTKDNLEESISSFYAEILRIKLLLDGTEKGEKVFFLLDEIFKGTNSKDRHTGATVLIKQLIRDGAIGLVSTHDLELCDLEENIIQIDNYNFREYYEDNKIKFDYKLRKGKSTTQNAIHLMRLAGIDFNE